MKKQSPEVHDTKSPVARQLIVCAVAVGIMGLGAWSLMGQNAPYHPEALDNEVSRDSGVGILNVDEGN
jgi:hypothetical protein